MSCYGFISQHSGNWGGRLPHVGPLRLAECFLCFWTSFSLVGLLHVEISTQRRRQVMLQLCQWFLCCLLSCTCSTGVSVFFCAHVPVFYLCFVGPIITLESLGSSGAQSKLTKRHWLRLLKQPAVWWDKASVDLWGCDFMSNYTYNFCTHILCSVHMCSTACLFSYSDG